MTSMSTLQLSTLTFDGLDSYSPKSEIASRIKELMPEQDKPMIAQEIRRLQTMHDLASETGGFQRIKTP